MLENSALAYAQEDGFHVFPLQPKGKVPLTSNGFEDATTDAMTIETWWARWPDANVGIRTGAVIVIDEDRDNALRELAEILGEELPPTRVATTGKGRHYYFTQPDSFRVRNTASKIAQGIDTRGDGGYVVAPPSIHPSGAAYAWESEADIAPLPSWLAELLRPVEAERRQLAPAPMVGDTTAYGQRALEEETRAVATAPEGTRNDRLNTAAFALGQLVAGGELDERDAQHALQDAASACGLGDREAAATIRSGFTSGLNDPRQAPERPLALVPPLPAQTPLDVVVAPALIRVVNLAEFVAVTEDSADPILGTKDDSLLPADGFLLMYGDGGAGKTTLSIDALAHLASGTPWLDTPIPNPSRVLLIENEGPRGPFRGTLEKKIAKWTGDPFHELVRVLEEPWTQFTLDDAAYREAIAQEINASLIDIVIVGPLASLGAKGTGTPDDVNDFASMISDLRNRASRPFALWIVHHENKAGDVSGAWERLPDTLVHVSAQGNGRTRVHWRKVRWSSRLHNTSIGLLWDDGGFTLEEARVRDLPVELLEAFTRDDRWRTAKEAAGLIAANQDRVRETLMQLVIDGHMSFRIGPDGRNANAKCWRLKSDSEPLSHPESPGLFGGAPDVTDSVTPPYKESPESSHHHLPNQTDSDSPSQISPDDLESMRDDWLDQIAAAHEDQEAA